MNKKLSKKKLASMQLSTIPRFYFVKSKLTYLYLTGLRSLYEERFPHKYNKGKKYLLLGMTALGLKWMMHKIKHQDLKEFERYEQPNIFIPKYVYKARIDSYRYWELQRLFTGLETRFRYFMYDEQEQFMLYFDEEGKRDVVKNIFSQENVEHFDNPIFEKVYRWYFYERTPEIVKKGNTLVAYDHFKHDQNELHNYLTYKSVNLMDLVRAFWHLYMTKLKLTNAYRYDHLLKRPFKVYEYERVKQALNMSVKHKEGDALRYLKLGSFLCELTK